MSRITSNVANLSRLYGSYRDTLMGGAGDDILRGGDNKDVLNGGYNNDSLYGNDGKMC